MAEKEDNEAITQGKITEKEPKDALDEVQEKIEAELKRQEKYENLRKSSNYLKS